MLGYHWFAVRVGVASKDENSSSLMRCADIGRKNLDGGRFVAKHVQVSPHRWQPLSRVASNVLNDNEERGELSDNSGKLAPKA
jgi:hypothetical protein